MPPLQASPGFRNDWLLLHFYALKARFGATAGTTGESYRDSTTRPDWVLRRTTHDAWFSEFGFSRSLSLPCSRQCGQWQPRRPPTLHWGRAAGFAVLAGTAASCNYLRYHRTGLGVNFTPPTTAGCNAEYAPGALRRLPHGIYQRSRAPCGPVTLGSTLPDPVTNLGPGTYCTGAAITFTNQTSISPALQVPGYSKSRPPSRPPTSV